MPYPPSHKAETRTRIVESARQLFNHHGFETVSIDDIMARAGLTRGGFYHHFQSKAELFSEAVACFGERNPADRWDNVELDFSAAPEAVARQMIVGYLSRQHLNDIDGHCPMMALPSDAARAGPEVRGAYQDLVIGMIGVYERGLGEEAANGRQKAIALATLCIGAMVLARTFEDEALSEEVRSAAETMAIELAGFKTVAAA